ncbi:MAG: hypothetical protein AB1729_10055 [Pseudomonadota bacterium]
MRRSIWPERISASTRASNSARCVASGVRPNCHCASIDWVEPVRSPNNAPKIEFSRSC